MFGYVLPDKPELRVRDWDAYRAVYCSLCYALKGFGPFAKLLLHYDFVFAAMLQMAVNDSSPAFFDSRCNTNPLQKERRIEETSELRYAAACLILSAHYKLKDDQLDESFFKRIGAFFARLFTGAAYRRARAQQPDVDRYIAQQMQAQRKIEQQRSDSVDLACDPSANGLAFIFERMVEDPDTKRVLHRLGYLMGRFAYLADAADDLHDDVAKNRYNVFAVRDRLKKGANPASSIEEAKQHLRLTAAESELCYRLLDIRQFQPILDNIIYRGLPATIQRVGRAKKGTDHERSL